MKFWRLGRRKYLKSLIFYMDTSRRQFISVLGQLLLFPAVASLSAGTVPDIGKGKKVTFGIISDIHKGLQKDAERRLGIFIDKAIEKRPDFIIQLGDMTHGKPEDVEAMLEVWNRFPGKKYHVLGNHEMDGGDKGALVKQLQMPGNFYSFDVDGYHFVVLDANYFKQGGRFYDKRPSKKEGLPVVNELLSDAELEWLKKDLLGTRKPSILFSHEAFDDIWQAPCSSSTGDVRRIIREVNAVKPEGFKVIASICGHHHIDNHKVIEGVQYIQINSASYFWIGRAAAFSNGHMAEYKHPLFAFITLDSEAGTIEIKGTQSEFLPPVPTRENYPQADKLYPGIKDRVIVYR